MVSSIRNYLFYFICLQSAGSYSFSIGITEVLSTNLVLELSANDVEYVYQRYNIYLISTYDFKTVTSDLKLLFFL